MRLGISSNLESIEKKKIVLTPTNFDEAMELFGKTVRELVKNKKIEKSVGGIRGVLNREKNAIAKDMLLLNWVKKPLLRRISDITDSQVFLENDTALCGLGEANYGAGKGFKIVSYITISSGVGGVRIVEGKIDENSYGFEPGHQIIDADASLLEKSGKEFLELEDCVSGTALKLRFGRNPSEITDPVVWRDIEKFLAIGITNTILHWSSDVVIIGGGVGQIPQISIQRLKVTIKKYLKIFPKIPQIKKGKLKDSAGLYGALYKLKEI